MELVFLIAALLLAGFASGVLAGLLGVGGGIVLVPVLFQTFIFMGMAEGLQIHMAVGTSLAIICFTSWQSARTHWRKGAVDENILRDWGIYIGLGALIGAIAARFIAPEGLKLIFAGFSLILGARMLLNRDTLEARASVIGSALQRALASLIGFFSALMGIGGGTFSVPLLGLTGRDLRQAVATSAALGFIIAVPATLGFVFGGWGASDLPRFSLGYVSLLAAALMIPTSMIGAPIGAHLAHNISRPTLNKIFAAFLLLGGGRIIFSLF